MHNAHLQRIRLPIELNHDGCVHAEGSVAGYMGGKDKASRVSYRQGGLFFKGLISSGGIVIKAKQK